MVFRTLKTDGKPPSGKRADLAFLEPRKKSRPVTPHSPRLDAVVDALGQVEGHQSDDV
jgi:hypothetical protein